MFDNDFRITNKDIIYDGPVKFRIDTFNFKGKTFRKEVVEHSPSVGIIPLLNDKHDILLIKQFRHAVNRFLIEIPAGKMEKDESPIEAAKRELAEETGYSGDLKYMTNCYLAPSYDTEMMNFFIAENISKTNQPEKMDDDEEIDNIVINVEDALEYCYNGTIVDCKTVSAIFLYYYTIHNKKNIRDI